MRNSFKMILAAIAVAASASSASAYDGEQYVVCKLNPNGDNFLAFRTCGSTNCAMTQKLAPGSFVVSTEPTAVKGWREVILQSHIEDWSYGGPVGWVYGKYLCEVRY